MIRDLRKRVARAIIIDRATWQSRSIIGRVARQRTEENYRFAGRFVRGQNVLDIGGGNGIGHDLLLAQFPASLLSLDRYAVPAEQHRDARVRFVQGDFPACPLPENSFDVIICLGTLFYLDDCEAAVAMMHRLLRPAGMLIINCINQQLVRRYFGMPLEEIDGKFTAAFDESGFDALLKRNFKGEPEYYVQQPVPCSGSFSASLSFWLAPLTWPLRRHPVMARPSGTEGMYIYGIVRKNR